MVEPGMREPTGRTSTPRFFPISYLSVMDDAITGSAESVQKQARNMERLRDNFGLIGHAELMRMQRVYGENTEYVELYREQLRRWRSEATTTDQIATIDRLDGVVDQWSQDVLDVLRSVNALLNSQGG